MLQLTSNIDLSIVYFSQWLQSRLKEYPNPNKSEELKLCQLDNLVKIVRKESEHSEHFDFIQKESIPLSIIVQQKGEFEYLYDTASSFKTTDKKVITTEDREVALYGKSAKYKSPIKISVIARSLFACKTLSFYISILLSETPTFRYPAVVMEDGVKIGEIKDYCSIKLNLPHPISFIEDPLKESYYRMSLDFHFTDSYLFFKEGEEENKNFSLEFTLRDSEIDYGN